MASAVNGSTINADGADASGLVPVASAGTALNHAIGATITLNQAKHNR